MSELVVDNPYTLEVACAVPLADKEQAKARVLRARRAFESFRGTPLDQRMALAQRATEALVTDGDAVTRRVTATVGKPLQQSKNELAGFELRARTMIELAPGGLADVLPPSDAETHRRIVKSPLGVVLDFPAWNYPLVTAVNVVIPAVLAGNAVIIKHSMRSPTVGDDIARAFERAGAPTDLVQSVHCSHEVSAALVAHELVDHVVFTGSVKGGREISQAAAGKWMQIGYELGGCDPAYVAGDADLESTVANIVDGAIYNAGQSCCAVERVYVHRSLYTEFLMRAQRLIEQYVMGDPLDAATTLGPIAQPYHPAELEEIVKDARANGGRVLIGGHATTVDKRGRFFEPTLIADASHAMRIMRDESFGPTLPVMPVHSDDEALALMNDSRYGLTASVWTKDRARAERFATNLEAGTVFMNRCDAVDPYLAWSGVRDSGRGHSLSTLGFDQLTRTKSILFRLA